MVTNNKLNETIKNLIAHCSYRSLNFSFAEYIDRNESKQLIPKKTEITPVTSSITDSTLNPENLKVVSTTKQNPRRLDDVPNMFADFSVVIILFFLICRFFYQGV